MKKSKDYNDRDFSSSRRECKDDRAKGELLEIAINAEALSLTIDEISTPSCWPGMSTSGFMRDGIRTNGMLERAGSLSRLSNKITHYLSDLVEAEEDIKDRRLKAKKMLELLKDYSICGECAGERGELIGPNYFIDCENCDGQGMVKK